MRIGISTLSTAEQNIWSAGITQNALFLAKLLRSIPFVQDVVLLDVGSEDSLGTQVDFAWFGTRMLKLQDATDQLDVIIEMAGAIDTPWLNLQRARGKKVVWHCVGQPYTGLVESTLFKDSGFFIHGADRHDAIWVLPKDEVFIPMLRTLHQCPVQSAPYIWDPVFLQQRIDEVGKSGLHFGYIPRTERRDPSAGWKLAIFEPNISPIKSGLISMLVVDAAYREAPDSIQQLYVLNTEHLVQHPTLLYFANALDVVRQHKTIFTGRHDIAGFVGLHHVDAVVAHQWQNDQNYAYLDALYGGYPLVHNSPWIKQAGYYYPDFEVQQGAAQLRHAIASHDENLQGYAERSAHCLKAVALAHEPNVKAYADLLRALCSDKPEWLEA
jgi:hypothetical protein